MSYLYLFALIVGGGLLGASILLGGSDGDADVGDTEADLGGDPDLAVQAGFPSFLSSFLSLRFWTFFSAFFGLTGLTLRLLLHSVWLELPAAIVAGTAAAAGAAAVFRALSRDTGGETVSSRDYIGKTARVVVPIGTDSVGKVRVRVKGQSVDLLATGVDPEDFRGREEVLIVEMEGPRARVARLQDPS